MTYRILLIVSGLTMMFAVYGLVMTIGALVDESDAWIGNLTLGGTFTVISASCVTIGMMMRKKVQKRLDQEIDREFLDLGYVEASLFAKEAGVSLDDARDQLDRRMRDLGWKRTELESYNARYYRL